MSVIVYLAVAGLLSGAGFIAWQFYTRHWNLANITSDLDGIVADLEKHIDFQARRAAALRAKAAAATTKAQSATDSSVQASKIASNVKALLGRE